MISVPEIAQIRDKGRQVVIVALVGGNLHIRIFDSNGEKVANKAENAEVASDRLLPGETVTALKKLFKFIAIEMTIPGVLRAGKWRTQDQLSTMSAEEQRKALVEIMKQHAKEPTGYYFESLEDDVLIGIAAVVVFLLRSKIRDQNWLKDNYDDDHRNTLITENNGHTGISGLQDMDNQKLVQIGLDRFNKSFIRDSRGRLDDREVIDAAAFAAGYSLPPVGTHAKAFDELREKGIASFTVAVPAPNETVTENPFYSDANVRLRKVRVWIRGFESKDGMCCVKITHRGDEVFRKTDKTIVPVTHEPVTFQFKYNVQKMIWNEANHYVENPEETLLIGGMDATIVSTGDYSGGVYPPLSGLSPNGRSNWPIPPMSASIAREFSPFAWISTDSARLQTGITAGPAERLRKNRREDIFDAPERVSD